MTDKQHLDSATLERLLAGDAIPEAEAHLAVCAACRRVWENSLRAHRWLSHQAEVVPAPPGLYAAVMRRVEAAPPTLAGAVTVPRLAWWSMVVAAALWAVVGGVILAVALYTTSLGPTLWALGRALAYGVRGWTKILWAVWQATDLGLWVLLMGLLCVAALTLWVWALERARVRLGSAS